MGLRILDNRLYCSTSEVAFGPSFANAEEAEEFLRYVWHIYRTDARQWPDAELQRVHAEWRGQP